MTVNFLPLASALTISPTVAEKSSPAKVDAGPGALEMEISSLALAFGVVEGAANNDSENGLESGT